ncbi:MAG: DUF433 domain-containing protein [Patescibacteria group bacterium]
MNYQKRIVINSKVMVGKPVVAGTRITVEQVLTLLSQGVTADELASEKYYPQLTKADVYAAVAYAKDRIEGERVYPLG